MTISIIAAMASNRAIGKNNELIYWLPNDMKRFRTLTTGNTIIMGRKTFESLPKGALPNRRNIVLSRQADLKCEGAEVYTSLQEALDHCKDTEKVYIIGGASVYEQAMPLATNLNMTLVEDIPEGADAFFPEIQKGQWEIEQLERYDADEKHAHAYSFVNYERVK